MRLKFKYKEEVLVKIENEFFYGIIDAYDAFSKKYLVYIETNNFGNEWFETKDIYKIV